MKPGGMWKYVECNGSVHSISSQQKGASEDSPYCILLPFRQRESTPCLFPEFEIDPQWDGGTDQGRGGCDGMWVWIPNMETVNVVEPNCCMDASFEDAPTSHRSAKHLLGLAEVN